MRNINVRSIDLNLFVVFDAIFAEANLTRAGERLGLTQPAVSHALRRLRETLGDPLFVRQGAGVVPTPYAREIIGDVRDALGTLEYRIKRTGGFDPAAARRTFSLALHDGLDLTLLPPLLDACAAGASGIDLACIQIPRRRIEPELASGASDLAVDISLPLGDDIRRVPLYSDRLVVLASPLHAAPDGVLTIEDYLAARHILVSARRRGMSLEDVELNRAGLRRSVAVRCQSYVAACALAVRSGLLLTVPERVARALALYHSVACFPFPLDAALDVHLYWHVSSDNDPGSRWLRGQLLAASSGPSDIAS